MTKCKARAFIFSGRSDPIWFLNEQQKNKLIMLWEGFDPANAQVHIESKLGYRGVSMICPDYGEFFAYGRYVRRMINNRIEWRVDDKKLFEQFLLSTAPEGLLPPEIFNT